MKEISYFIGIAVVLCFVIGIVAYALGSSVDVQQNNTSVKEKVNSSSSFFISMSEMFTPVIVILAIIALFVSLLLFFRGMMPKWRG